MKPTAAGIAKIAAAMVAAGASAAAGAYSAHEEHGAVLEQLVKKVDALAAQSTALAGQTTSLQTDVRLLKCAADFPGDCPGQAKKTR